MATTNGTQGFGDFFDQLIEGFVGAVDDVRHTFEQTWFGQEVSGDIASPEIPMRTFEELWAPAEQNTMEQQRETERRTLDIGL